MHEPQLLLMVRCNAWVLSILLPCQEMPLNTNSILSSLIYCVLLSFPYHSALGAGSQAKQGFEIGGGDGGGGES